LASVTPRKRTSDGGLSWRVRWRIGGSRSGELQTETFSRYTDQENESRARDFAKAVELAGHHWPEGWVKGRGYFREDPAAADEPTMPVRTFLEVGLEFIDQNIDCSPGQRKRNKQQVRTFTAMTLRKDGADYFPFDRPIADITEDDIRRWRRQSTRALKTQQNYHGLLSGIFSYALKKQLITEHPALHTAPKRALVRQAQGDMRFLTEPEFRKVVHFAEEIDPKWADFVRLLAGTGMRFGEATALWVSNVDLKHRTIRINKAWKRLGEDDEDDIPPWLKKLLRPKHKMRGHYLGVPKTPTATRTIGISRRLADILARHMDGKAADDFLFTSATGLPIHNGDFSDSVWLTLMGKCAAMPEETRIAPFRKHDLRHSHVSWLIASGVPLINIQRRLGHADYSITANTYGHLLPQTDDHIDETMDSVFDGEQVRNPARPYIIQGGLAELDIVDPDDEDGLTDAQ